MLGKEAGFLVPGRNEGGGKMKRERDGNGSDEVAMVVVMMKGVSWLA